MCGRYSIVLDEAKLKQQLSREIQFPVTGLPTNYNVAPTQNGVVITNREPNRVKLFRWGLVPHWAKDLKIGVRMINARREGIATKPSFRKPIREKRCLVVADSFYEWQRHADGKTPQRIFPADGRYLVMAGIWEQWWPSPEVTDPVRTFSIITGAPNAEMAPVHDRMPMLLMDERDQNTWLDPDAPLDDALALLTTPRDGVLEYYPVPAAVGNVRNNGPALHERVEA
ncbi:MAG: SOS response-associated peptidase [Bacteroidota bacterium]